MLLEPIMLVTCSVPDESVGDVMGDLSSRRGRPLGTEAVGGMTEVKAEVPMSEMLTYAPDLRSMTGGQGEYTLEFLRYEEIPAHLAQKVAEKAREEAEAVAHRERLRSGRGRGALLASPSVMARTRDIRTNQLDVACDVCGRTLLRGEHAEHFLAGGERRHGLRSVHRARPARGLDPRVRRRRPRAAPPAPRGPRALVHRAPALPPRARARGQRASRREDARAPPIARRRQRERERDAAASRAARAAARARATSAPCRPTPS